MKGRPCGGPSAFLAAHRNNEPAERVHQAPEVPQNAVAMRRRPEGRITPAASTKRKKGQPRAGLFAFSGGVDENPRSGFIRQRLQRC